MILDMDFRHAVLCIINGFPVGDVKHIHDNDYGVNPRLEGKGRDPLLVHLDAKKIIDLMISEGYEFQSLDQLLDGRTPVDFAKDVHTLILTRSKLELAYATGSTKRQLLESVLRFSTAAGRADDYEFRCFSRAFAGGPVIDDRPQVNRFDHVYTVMTDEDMEALFDDIIEDDYYENADPRHDGDLDRYIDNIRKYDGVPAYITHHGHYTTMTITEAAVREWVEDALEDLVAAGITSSTEVDDDYIEFRGGEEYDFLFYAF